MELELAVVDGERGSAGSPPHVVGDRGVDRRTIVQRVVDAEVVEESEPLDVERIAVPVFTVLLNIGSSAVVGFVVPHLHARARNEIGPEHSVWKRPYVEIEIVDLVLTLRVS